MIKKLTVLALGLVGCTTTEPRPPGSGSLLVLSTPQADSVVTSAAGDLVVRIVGGSRGMAIRFDSDFKNDYSVPYVTFPGPTNCGGGFFPCISFETQLGKDGIARAPIHLGIRSGNAYVRIRVPDLGLTDSVRLTIRPGPLARISAEPHDTALLVGGRATIRLAALDLYGNLREDPVSLNVFDSPVSLEGHAITAQSIGRGHLLATSGGISADVAVSVVPDGDLSAITPEGVVIFRTDGVIERRIPNGTRQLGSASWSGDGRKLVFDADTATRIREVSEDGVVTDLSSRLHYVSRPRFAVAIGAVFYLRLDGAAGARVDRIDMDGGQSTVWTGAWGGQSPAPSPDGNVLALDWGGSPLELYNLNTGHSTFYVADAAGPGWSPDGTRIAYFERRTGRIRVLSVPSGTDQAVTPLGTNYAVWSGLDWSPDSRWIVVQRGDGGHTTGNNEFQLIEAATGLVLPLGYVPEVWTGPAWKPR